MPEQTDIKENLSAFLPLKLQVGEEGKRREYSVTFISAGRVRSRDGKEADWEIPADTIKAAISLMNAKAVFVDHTTWLDDYPHMDRMAAVTFGAEWNETNQSADGGIRMYTTPMGDCMVALFDDIIKDQADGKEVPDVGLSLTFFGKHDFIDITEDEADYKKYLRVTKEITHIESVDIVFGPGTKGARFKEVLSSFNGGMVMEPCKECGNPQDKCTCDKTTDVGQPIAGPSSEGKTQLNAPVGYRLIDPHGNTIEVDPEQLFALPALENTPEGKLHKMQSAITGLTQTVENLSQKLINKVDSSLVKGNPSQDKTPKPGDSQVDMVARSYERLMGLSVSGKTYRFGGLRDMYLQLTGDYSFTGRYDPESARIKLNPEEVYNYLIKDATEDELMTLAYNPSGNNADTTTMAELTRNVMNKVMIDQVNLLDEYMWWKQIVKTENFDSLQQASWVRVGGVADLPTVNEKAEYGQIAWEDARTTVDFVKKGGYLPLSLEMIDRDDLAGWRLAPRALTTAAVVTLSGIVAAMFTDNLGTGPSITTEGSTANLFDATWGNVINQPLTPTNWSLAVSTMYKLGQLNVSGRRQAVRPRYLLVPIELETEGLQAATQSNEPGSFNDVRSRRSLLPPENVITVPEWTNADNWAALANPAVVPLIGVAFRFGESPELFVEPSNTGLMFFNDVMPIKVRYFFGVGAIDPRGGIKSNN